MIEENDKVLIALSGGKDSLLMLEILSESRKYLPQHFDLFACHVMAEGVDYHIDREYLSSFCSLHHVELFFKTIEVYPEVGSKKQHCFVCSWNRRKKLFETCRALQCNKLAFGHHMDDAVETLIMNMIYHGSISALPQKIAIFEGDITIIRPLLLLKEQNIQTYADYKGYQKELKSCRYEDNTQRNAIKQIISELNELNPKAKLNIFRSMENIYNDYLPKRP